MSYHSGALPICQMLCQDLHKQSHLILLQLCEVSTGIVPILQMGRLRLGEAKELAQIQTTSK